MEENEEEKIVSQESASQEQTNNEEKKTFTLEEVEEMKDKMKEDYEKSFNEKFNTRWGKKQREIARENSEKDELINLLKEQTGKESLKDLLSFSYEQYGVDRPQKTNIEDETKLGKLDAKEILSLDIDDIKEEATRLAGIKRTAREEATFLEIGKFLTDNKKKEARKEELKNLDIAEKNLLDDENFKTYMSKFKDETPLKEIYDNYKLTQPKKKTPFREGSLKDDTTPSNEVKEFYTFEESKNFTRKDFDKNPKLFKAIQNSMLQWGKK